MGGRVSASVPGSRGRAPRTNASLPRGSVSHGRDVGHLKPANLSHLGQSLSARRKQCRWWPRSICARNRATGVTAPLIGTSRSSGCWKRCGHAPRPFILYVTEPSQAEKWLEILKGEGFLRVDCFHGKTPGDNREKIIKQWAQDRLDCIVATSAFGVGMDKADVRTVVHATVPETLDKILSRGRTRRQGWQSQRLRGCFH